MPQYAHLVDEAVEYVKQHAPESEQEKLNLMIDRCAVNFGTEILKIVPGYVSTEVDARLSYDVKGNIKRARRIISMYEEQGIPRNRILIKLAATYEGVEAAKVLEAENIQCNMTLLFAFEQAVLCGEAGVTLISPFVGRIMDWYKKDQGVDGFEPQDDPGCKSVKRIYNYYKKHGIKTIIMGASFRNKGELLELAGWMNIYVLFFFCLHIWRVFLSVCYWSLLQFVRCLCLFFPHCDSVDRLTIAPKFLAALKDSSDDAPAKLSIAAAQASQVNGRFYAIQTGKSVRQ